jgi:hypothetical protein
MNVDGFNVKHFKFICDDGHTKTFTHKKSKILFVKQWLDLVPNESIELLDSDSEQMYYDLNPNILIKTIIGSEYLEVPLVEYTLEGSKKLYGQINEVKCAIILTAMKVLMTDNE